MFVYQIFFRYYKTYRKTNNLGFVNLTVFNFFSKTPEPPTAEELDPSFPHKDRLSDLKIIDNLLKTYDRRATPTNKFGKPTQVGCELFIRSFGSISEKTMVSSAILVV